jgi:HlyD family secretion protein
MITVRRAAVAALVVGCSAAAAMSHRTAPGAHSGAAIRRGTLAMHAIAGGTLKPIRSLTYASPVPGRELEIVEIAPEGTRVRAGDLLFRLDTRELERELARAREDVRQVRVDIITAEVEKKEADADARAVSDGDGTIAIVEASAKRDLAQRTVARLRAQRGRLEPLARNGYISRDELQTTVDELAQAEEDLALARKRADVLAMVSHPHEERRAALLLAQKEAQLENVRVRAMEADTRLAALETAVRNCRVYARGAGLVVYEDLMSAGPPRKIRAGDRVSSSQPVLTLPDIDRMQLEASVAEFDVRPLRPAQRAVIHVEALPGREFAGTVARVGMLGRVDGPLAAKRFDVVLDIDAPDADLRPGMTARADVLVGTRENVLLAPISAVVEEHGVTVVHVLTRGGRVETRPVVVGASSGTEVEIVSGVVEGDEVEAPR